MVHIPSRPFCKALGALCAALFAGIAALSIATGSACAEPRVALVIGNSAYKGDLPQLPNPANDAKLMARTLKGLGFDVIEEEDADQATMKKAIAAFGDKLTAAGSTSTGLFYYAGHGLQVGGENYLIPVDAQISKEADVDLTAVSTTAVMKQMDFAGSAVNIVILDACRNNPLSNGARGMTRGLAEIKSTPRGSFIAYSTAPGSVAQDGDGADSPYTTALAATITQPGVSIGDVFQQVRSKVLAATGQQQITWDSSSLTGQFYFNPASAPASPAAAQPAAISNNGGADTNNGATSDEKQAEELQIEKSYWDTIKDDNDPDELEAYLKKFPNGYFTDLANDKLSRIKGTQVASIAPGNSSNNNTADRSTTPQPVQPEQTSTPPLATATPAMTFADVNQTLYARGDGRVRAAPDAHSDLLAQLQVNTPIQANGLSNDQRWWRVAMSDGRIGYMHRSVVADQPLQTAAQAAPASNGIVADNGNAIQMDGSGNSQSVQTGTPLTVSQAGELVNAGANPPANLSQAAQGLLSLLSGGGGQQQQQQQSGMQDGPNVVFVPFNRTIVVRPSTMIMNAPGGQPVAHATQESQMQASARTSDGRWYQVTLPNGTFGFVAGQYVER